jgi:chlorobactene glucosyltransferase
MTFVFWYQGMIALILLIVLWNFAGNLRYFRRLSSYPRSAPGRQPFVSILVPARNEERNITRCVESLVTQDYPEFEVIVLNDNSTDRTAEILTELQAQYPRLRVLQGKALPAGWVGKNFACYQLYGAAGGDFLFFTDADTWHHPLTIAKSVAALRLEGGDLLSAIPQEEVQSLSERMVVPFMHFAVLCFLPLRWIWNHASPLFSFSVGQFMFFRRTAYERIGGHAAIPGELVEDMALGRRIKQTGCKLLLLDGNGMTFCRMYHSTREVWAGFAKSIFAVFHFQLVPLVMLVTVANFLFLVPFLTFLIFCLRGDWAGPAFWLVTLQMGAVLLAKLLMSVRFSYPLVDVLLHPFSLLHLDLIIFYSTLQHILGIGVTWKGRRYQTAETPMEDWVELPEQGEVPEGPKHGPPAEP